MNLYIQDNPYYQRTSPLLPLNIESNVCGGAKVIAKELYEFIKNYDKLDVQTITQFVK